MNANNKTPDVAAVAALLGEPARAAMLDALLDGLSLSAGDLATRARVSKQTASAHLGKLEKGGLIKVTSKGKRRFFRLANRQVARALEALAQIAPKRAAKSQPSGRAADAIRRSRTCYDHLAGKLGVAVTEAMVTQKLIRLKEDTYQVTNHGRAWFEDLGIDVDAARQLRRKFAYPCLDWTEKRHHLAGSLGAALVDTFLQNGWIKRHSDCRALRVTPKGETALLEHLGMRFHGG